MAVCEVCFKIAAARGGCKEDIHLFILISPVPFNSKPTMTGDRGPIIVEEEERVQQQERLYKVNLTRQ